MLECGWQEEILSPVKSTSGHPQRSLQSFYCYTVEQNKFASTLRQVLNTADKQRINRQSNPEEISVELSSRRTGMSFQRTRMSADRTLMSVVRTSLSLISFGFTIFQFFSKLVAVNLETKTSAVRHFAVALVL